MEKFDLIILGAGAAGLMSAAFTPEHFKTLIIEANPSLAKKIRISGGGKCNITNRFISPDYYLANPEFVTPALQGFTCKDSLEFFDGIALEERDKGKLFGKESSKLFIERLQNRAKNAKIELNSPIHGLTCKDDEFILYSQKNSFTCKHLIVACGSLAWPQVGVSGIGYEIAKSFGHTIIEPKPALVPMTLQSEQFWMKSLSGIAFEVGARVGEKKLQDALLFSHKGLSGPLMMDVSLFWEKGQISLDFWPDGSVKKMLKSGSKKLISSAIPLPKRFLKAFLEALKLEDKPINSLTCKEKTELERLHEYSFAPAGKLGFIKSEVAKGGVNTDEIDPFTMESKLQKRLYFVGEVLDVTGCLGGYNLHWAFASAKQCAQNLR